MRQELLPNEKPSEEWQRFKLGDLCYLKTGGTPSRGVKEYWDGGTVNWLVSGDVNKEFIYEVEGKITKEGLDGANTKILPVNSVLIALNGQGKTRAKVAVLKTESTCNQSIVALIPKNEKQLYYLFLFYSLKASYQKLRNMTGDNQRSGLTMRKLREFEIEIPSSVEEQVRIASKLELQMAKIESIKKEAEKEMEAVKDIFQSFLRKTFNSKGILEAKRKPFGEVTINHDGKRVPIKTADRMNLEKKYPYYGASGIIDYIDDYIFDGEFLLIGEDGENLRSRKKPLAFLAKGKFWVNNHAHVLDTTSEISKEFLMNYINLIDLRPWVAGAAQPKLNQKKMNSILVPVPSMEIQNMTLNIIRLAQNMINELNIQTSQRNSAISLLSSSLLHEVFGKYRVPEADDND